MKSLAVFVGGIAVAGLGGFLFSSLEIPLAWILGAMVGSAIWTNLFGAGGKTKYVRRTGQVIVGAATGAILTPAMLGELVELLPAMLGAAVLANVVGVLLSFPLARLARVDRRTALLSTIPAGMSEMASLAREVGAKAEVVTVVHTLRVVLVVGCIPFLFGYPGYAAPEVEAETAHYVALAAVVVAGALLSTVGARAGMLNPWVLMPMATGVLVVIAGFPLAGMPRPLLVGAQILIGFSLGARLRKEDFARVPRAAAAGFLVSAALLGTMLLAAALVFPAWTGIPAATLALALAPGGIGEMIASAKALGVGAGLVAGFQFTRSFLTNLIAPPLLMRLAGPPPPKVPGP